MGKPKHQLLSELGFVAPRIIKKIRDTRNLLEHEYKAPSKSQVEDAIDVATLYIANCTRMLFWFPDYVMVFNEDVERDTTHLFKTYVSIKADWQKENFKLSGVVNLNSITKPITIRTSDATYFLLVRLFVATQIDMQVNDKTSVVRALDAIKKFLVEKE